MVESGLSTRDIAKKENVSQSSIMYWLRKFSIKRKPRPISTHCSICDSEIKSNKRNRATCASCRTRIRRLKNKIKAVNLLGGKCVRCGFDEHLACMEFHHKNQSEKLFEVGRFINKSWDSIREEIKKCELLCSNCHRIEHSSRYDDERLINYVAVAQEVEQ